MPWNQESCWVIESMIWAVLVSKSSLTVVSLKVLTYCQPLQHLQMSHRYLQSAFWMLLFCQRHSLPEDQSTKLQNLSHSLVFPTCKSAGAWNLNWSMEWNVVLLNNLPLRDECQHRVCPLQACAYLHKSKLTEKEKKKRKILFQDIYSKENLLIFLV